jgi:hypothetical protein
LGGLVVIRRAHGEHLNRRSAAAGRAFKSSIERPRCCRLSALVPQSGNLFVRPISEVRLK